MVPASDLWERLGFRGQDLADVRAAASGLLSGADADARARQRSVADAAAGLGAIVGSFRTHSGVFGDKEAEAFAATGVPGHGWGVAAVLALAAAVPEVRSFHRARGIPDAVSWATLGDLAQQVRVHRLTYGEFGLHAHGWLLTAWSGALYWLGRLQFNLHWYEPTGSPGNPVAEPAPRWVLSTHIPATGALEPAAVTDSFNRAKAFFAEHFSDFPVSEFHCDSWLLDPRLAQLSPESNTARFQGLWRLDGVGRDCDSDAVFFIWNRRDGVDPASLPVDSSLRRLVAGEMAAGRPWQSRRGLIAFDGLRAV
nr:acyltransferase domain-containing protein [Tessaracoccus sp. OS52]